MDYIIKELDQYRLYNEGFKQTCIILSTLRMSTYLKSSVYFLIIIFIYYYYIYYFLNIIIIYYYVNYFINIKI